MKKISEILGNKETIKGFNVMEWLRGVRDTNYALSIKDPEEYYRREEKSKRHIELLERRAKRSRKSHYSQTFNTRFSKAKKALK